MKNEILQGEQRSFMVGLLEKLYNVGKKAVEMDGAHIPMLVIVTKDKNLKYVDFSQYIEDKDLMASMLEAHKLDPMTAFTVLITEAWVLEIPKDKFETWKKSRLTPSESPDRKEVLFLYADTPKGGLTAQAPFIRDGDKVTLGPLEIIDATETQGRFASGFTTE